MEHDKNTPRRGSRDPLQLVMDIEAAGEAMVRMGLSSASPVIVRRNSADFIAVGQNFRDLGSRLRQQMGQAGGDPGPRPLTPADFGEPEDGGMHFRPEHSPARLRDQSNYVREAVLRGARRASVISDQESGSASPVTAPASPAPSMSAPVSPAQAAPTADGSQPPTSPPSSSEDLPPLT